MEINLNRFYIIGMTCFLVVAVFSWANMIMIWDSLTWAAQISNSANIVFNFALVGFFYYLYKNQPNPSISSGDSSQSLEEVTKELKDNGF
jgi:amino acid transporter